MAKKIIQAQMKQRRDTKANWAAQNPVLLAGELGIVSDDPNLYKVGDGTTAWNALPFRGFDGTLVHTTGDSETAAMSQKGVTEELAKLSAETGELSASLEPYIGGKINIKDNGFNIGQFYNNYNNVASYQVDESSKRYNAIDLSKYIGKIVVVKITTTNAHSTRLCGLGTASQMDINNIRYEKSFCVDGDDFESEEWVLIPTEINRFLYISFSYLGALVSISVRTGGSLEKNAETIFVDAINGNDNNDGLTEDKAVATFAKALELTGARTNIILIGSTNESINIKKKPNQSYLRICGKSGVRNQIIVGQAISNASTYSGDVMSVKLNNFTQDGDYIVWQHNVSDKATQIADEDRHPLQRGKEYRLDSCRIIYGRSIDDVVSSDVLKYYYEASTSTLYFKKQAGTNLAQNPIVLTYSSDCAIYGNDGSVKVEISNIECLYGCLKLSKCHGAKVTDVACRFVWGSGAFVFDNAVGITFERCEAGGVSFINTNGDGFNGHSLTNTNENEYINGDAFAKHTTATLIDCWAHDIADDGFSDHERSEDTIIGGLFEFCGKGGLTPSYGAHSTCYNVVSRYNKIGFFYTGEVTSSEGGKYGQIQCISCEAYGNASSGYEFSNMGNVGYCKHCISRNNKFGYRSDAGTLYALDCYYADNSAYNKVGNVVVVELQKL